MIAKAYGSHRSPKQLWLKLFQKKQEDKEHPSGFLACIQAVIAEIDTLHNGFLGDNNYIRLLQFHMGLRTADHNQLNVYCDIKNRLHHKKYLSFPDLFQMMQDFEREQDERNERLGRKGTCQVQCGAVYATPAEKAEILPQETASSPVDLQHVLKELMNLKVKVDNMKQTSKKTQKDPKSSSPMQ